MGNLLTRITDCQRQMKNMFDVFEGTTPKVLILGLDGAGKTTFLYSAKLDDFIYAIAPPRGVIIEHITPRRGATLQLFDFPGSKLVRHLWHNWFQNVQGIIFVVDSADKVRIDEAKFELHDLLTSSWLRKVPLIVVANKQDLSDCMNEDEVANELDLHSIKNRDWSILGVSSMKKKGVKNVFEDMVEKVKALRHYKSSLKEEENAKKQSSDKDTEIEIKSYDNPVFTNIEDVESVVEEKIPSLFENINKNSYTEKDSKDDNTDSGSSTKESVTYDQMNVNKDCTEHSDVEKPDSVSDGGSDKDGADKTKDDESVNESSEEYLEKKSIDTVSNVDGTTDSASEVNIKSNDSSASENDSNVECETEESAPPIEDESSQGDVPEDSYQNTCNDEVAINDITSVNGAKLQLECEEVGDTDDNSIVENGNSTTNKIEMITDLDSLSDEEENPLK